MLEKVVVLIYDGLGDRPISEFGGKTPLEYADTPNFDKLAQNSICGMMHTLGRGLRPGSDTAHLAIFGYDISKYYPGRGPIEIAGLGIDLEDGDVALRGNMATVDENMIIKDRRAGRIADTSPFTELLDGMEIDGIKFIVKAGTGHRAGVVLRGKGLSSAIIDADPHREGKSIIKVVPTDGTPEAKFTAEVLNKFLSKAHEILKNHKLNKDRIAQGKLAANHLLVRGAGQYKAMPKFKEKYGLSACCIAGGGLYKGVGAFLGMEIIDIAGATAMPDTDIKAKFSAALEKLKTYDFVFVHVKATDTLAHDGNFEGKKEFIEKADDAMKLWFDLPKNTLLIVTGDHSTACEFKDHVAEPIPIMFYGASVRVDDVMEFNERACAKGGLGFMTGMDIMPEVMNLLGRAHLIGA